VDGYLEYQQIVWRPKIETIKRPVQNISLIGTITTVHNNSGLVKRFNWNLVDSMAGKALRVGGWSRPLDA